MGERVTNGSFGSGLAGWTVTKINGDGAAWVATGEWDPGVYYCYQHGWGTTAMSKICQSVDLTNVNSLTFDAWAVYDGSSGIGEGPGLYIDDVFISAINYNEEMESYDVDVSGYSGSHVICFALFQSEWGSALGITHVSAIGSDLPPAPVAAFTGYPTTGVAPLEVLFTDESTNTPTSWIWSFGDGTLSTVQHPWHTYANPGTYSVNLKATNAGGFGTLQKDNYIVVTVPPPSATLLWKFRFGPS